MDQHPLREPPEQGPVLDTEQAALSNLAEILSIPACGIELAELYGLIVDRVHRLLAADRAVLFEYDPDAGVLLARASRGFRRDDLAAHPIAPGKGFVGSAFRDDQTLFLTGDAGSDPLLTRYPSAYSIATPVRADSEPAGVLFLGRRSGVPLAPDELRLLHLLADRCGTALVHWRLMQRVSRQAERLRQLTTVPAAGVGLPLRSALSRTCEAGCRALGVPAGLVAVAAAEGREPVRVGLGLPEDALADWTADWEERLTAEDAAVRALDVKAVLPVPLRAGERVLGVAYFLDRGERWFTPDEVQVAEVVGALLAAVVENAAAFEGTQRAMQQLSAAQQQLIQTEKARALGGVAGGIAHEFNNLLAIILGKTQLALERADSAAVRDDLTVIEETAWRAADTVRRLLAFVATRSDEGMATVDLNALAHDVVTFTRPLWKDDAEARGIRIEVATDFADVTAVHGSATELREALTNLMLNAIDAMPRGGRITIRTRRRDHGVELAVTDTGEGMAAEVQSRVFDPFFTTRSPERAGLGLSVVHGIVGRHHGRIDVHSEEGRGTTVTLVLPEARASQEDARALPPATVSRTGTRGRVLVIEDEDHLRRMLADALTSAGHTVEAAANGLDGLARFQRSPFELVITDLSMPECSGLDVSRAVKRMSPKTPVIMITGWGDVMNPERMADSGVDLMLVKPFKIDRALDLVDEALARRHA
jgi:signal transduction histidine kinase/ActR/RegA family two-component response regulator